MIRLLFFIVISSISQTFFSQLDYGLNIKFGVNLPMNAESRYYITDFSNKMGNIFSLGFTLSKNKFLIAASVEQMSLGYGVKYHFITPDQNSNDPFIPDEAVYKGHCLGGSIGFGYKILNSEKNELQLISGFNFNKVLIVSEKVTFMDRHKERQISNTNQFANSFVSIPFYLSYVRNVSDRIGISCDLGIGYNFKAYDSFFITENPVLPKANVGFHYKL